jgi:hypothetical protein
VYLISPLVSKQEGGDTGSKRTPPPLPPVTLVDLRRALGSLLLLYGREGKYIFFFFSPRASYYVSVSVCFVLLAVATFSHHGTEKAGTSF